MTMGRRRSGVAMMMIVSLISHNWRYHLICCSASLISTSSGILEAPSIELVRWDVGGRDWRIRRLFNLQDTGSNQFWIESILNRINYSESNQFWIESILNQFWNRSILNKISILNRIKSDSNQFWIESILNQFWINSEANQFWNKSILNQINYESNQFWIESILNQFWNESILKRIKSESNQFWIESIWQILSYSSLIMAL